jgi:hypothetical protein
LAMFGPSYCHKKKKHHERLGFFKKHRLISWP